MEKLVPNPRYEELERALATVRTRGQTLQAALDPAFDLFTRQAVWVGPTAKVFKDHGSEMVLFTTEVCSRGLSMTWSRSWKPS